MENNVLSQLSQMSQTNIKTNNQSRKSLKIIHPTEETMNGIQEEEKFLYEKRQWEIEEYEISLDKIRKEQMEKYKAEWNWMVFIEFLIYHAIFYLVLGPLMNLIFGFYPGMTLMRNMKFYGHSPAFYVQTLLWGGSVLGGLSYFALEGSVISLTEVLFLWYALAIRCVVIAAKYATLSSGLIKLYKTVILPDDIFNFDLMMQDWRLQTSKILFLEPFRSLQRYQFEMSLFKMDFIVEPFQETKVAIEKVQIDYFRDLNIELGSEEYSGFNLFAYMVEYFQKNNNPNLHLIYSMIEALILGLTPILLRLGQMMFSMQGWDIFRMILNFLCQVFGFWGSNIFFHQAFYDFKRKFFLIDQLLLIIRVKPEVVESVKLLPTINFNNITTWQAWSMLRAISFDYGQTYNLRTQGFYSLCFLGFIILIFLSLLLILGFVVFDTFQLILLGEITFIILGFTGYYLYMGARLNSYLDECEIALQDVKSIYQDLLRMKDVYFVQNKEPQNYIHKKFKQLLQNESQVEEFIIRIISELDDNIRIIQFDSRNNPFKLYGVKVTFNLLKSVGVGLSTIYSYVLQQKYMNA